MLGADRQNKTGKAGPQAEITTRNGTVLIAWKGLFVLFFFFFLNHLSPISIAS